MTEFVVLAILFALLVCLMDLRLAMFAIVTAGFLQDLARKVVPDEPVYLTTTVVALATAAFASAMLRGVIPPFRRIPEWDQRLKWPAEVFTIVVVAQCVATYIYTSSIALAGIGLLGYLAPFPAFLMAFAFAKSFEHALDFLKLYVIWCAAVTSGVYLSAAGIEWDVLRSVGEPLVVYSLETGLPLELPSGFMRSPEIAAWHAASGFCVTVVLATVMRRPGSTILGAALCVFFMVAVFLTGRRKFFLEVVVFLPLLLVLLVRLGLGTRRLFQMLGVLVAAGVAFALFGLFTDDTVARHGEASMREEGSMVEATLARFHNLTIGAFEHVIDVNGLFGAGAGSGSQGAQHFGGGMDTVGLAAEGGLGKILAELGVPGLLAFSWVSWALVSYLWDTVAAGHQKGFAVGVFNAGLAAFLIANAVVFTGAHQAFGDLFVLLLIGCFVGFIMASRRWPPADVRAPHVAPLPDSPGFARTLR